MMKAQRGVLVSFSIRDNGNKEAEKLREIAYQQGVNEDRFFLANDIASLQAIHNIEGGELPDINFLSAIIFEAGRITGKREERARKRKRITSPEV